MSLLRQGRAYLLVGAAQWLLDCALTLGLSHAGMAVEAANLCGRIAGAGLGFWLNAHYTFASPELRPGPTQLRRFLLLWLVTTALSTAAMSGADAAFGLRGAWLAKPPIEITLALLGFVVSRQWVYR